MTLQQVKTDVEIVKHDYNVMLKRTKHYDDIARNMNMLKERVHKVEEGIDIVKDNINRDTIILEERLQNNIDDMFKGVNRKLKIIEDDSNTHPYQEQQETTDFLQDWVLRLEGDLSNLIKLCLHIHRNTPLPIELSNDILEEIDELGFRYDNLNRDYDKEIRSIIDTKRVDTYGQYIQISCLTSEIDESCHRPNDVKRNIEKLLLLIKELPNKEENAVEHIQSNTLSTTLNHANIVNEAILFHRKNQLEYTELISVIQAMLTSKEYTLCDTFMTDKLDFELANTVFLSKVAPHELSKDKLREFIFK